MTSQSFRQNFEDNEPVFDAIYTYLNVDISGTRNDIKKRSRAFFPVFLVFSYEKCTFLFHVRFNCLLPF